MKPNILRLKFKSEQQIDAIQKVRSACQTTYSLDYVHWLEDKLLLCWNKVEDMLPENEINVLCYHEDSRNYFICYRTLDCLTHEPKWFGGAMPTHWQFLSVPI